MERFASIFSKRFNNVLIAEQINATELAAKAGITIVMSYDYKAARSAPSGYSINKIIKVFPQYTCYLLGLDPKILSKQIILKD
ncbi:hypothetical protein CRYPD_1430 [uncultured Candidatus Thioglobus sp.]|nr:hypothetical protein CRYPD_1430 [uncultured Candidatus Thioglobus sp.]